MTGRTTVTPRSVRTRHAREGGVRETQRPCSATRQRHTQQTPHRPTPSTAAGHGRTRGRARYRLAEATVPSVEPSRHRHCAAHAAPCVLTRPPRNRSSDPPPILSLILANPKHAAEAGLKPPSLQSLQSSVFSFSLQSSVFSLQQSSNLPIFQSHNSAPPTRASGLVRHVGPPPPFRLISRPS